MTDADALVGRERELRLLGETIKGVTGGAGCALLISGEAGIGKTRFANHALEVASRRGFYTVGGRSPPLGRDLGYALIIQAFGGWLRSQSPPDRAKVTLGLPSLGVLFEDLDLSPPDHGADPALEKTRVFEAVVRLLGRIASAAPVAALFDDLHWADPGSLELLQYLSDELRGMPVLLLATYRPEEGTAYPPRFRVLRESLLRSGSSREVFLERLSDDEVRALLTERLGGEPSAQLAGLLIERSKGVPLFVEGLARWLRDTGKLVESEGQWELSEEEIGGLPPLVRDTILRRLDRLYPAARLTLEGIAVAGEAPLHVLQEVGPEQLDAELTALVQAGLVAKDDAVASTNYRVEHPLVAEVLYEEMAPPRRSSLHLALAGAYETKADRMAAATHYLAAGPGAGGERGTEILAAAGEESLRRYADEQAARFFQAAIAHAGRSWTEAFEQAVLGLGQARFRLGQLAEGIQHLRSLLELEREVEDPQERARIHRLIATGESERGDFEAADREVEAGLAVLGNRSPSEERLELLWIQAMTAARRPDMEAIGRFADPFYREAAAVGSPRAQVLGGFFRFSYHHHKGEYPPAAEGLEKLEALAERVGDTQSLRRIHDFKGVMAAALGDLEALRAAHRRSLDLGRRVGVPGWSHRLHTTQFLEAYLSGEWDQAREVLREAALATERLKNPRTIPTVPALEAMLATFQGDFRKAANHLEVGRSILAEGHPVRSLAGMILDVVTTFLALEQETPAAALATIEPIDPYLEAIMPPWGVVALAEAAIGAGSFDHARQVIVRLQSSGPPGSLPPAMAERLLGLVEVAEGHTSEGIARLLRSRRMFRDLGMPFEETRVTIEAGETMARGAPGRLGTIAPELSHAHEVAARLGARRYEERAGALLDKTGTPVSTPEATAEPELTPRQMEVSELVAKGLSNAEIAENLFISIRTVTSHLDHIYTRLGINSRAALATYVTELQLRSSDLRSPSDDSPWSEDE